MKVLALAILSAAVGIHAAAADTITKPLDTWSAQDQRAADAAERSQELLDREHQRWRDQQRDVKTLLTPRPLKLEVPIYKPPSQ
ncbi:hypothetical protein NA8A_08354 [Nitratireductor indicus C115]|uniref:Conjugal transfer protein n=2 Tax=Nitratireductor indicus TaxID=721133 RepID=K2NXN9_9HYPH|nr:hypothetical protein [Nitratireductor indicus]EKF42664.1 hypothetical protein NA8A_08354 [Nitratireductor indicus C115]SFQ38494.1 hypothetical protein SAMN05216176_10345 [Nitratireductor indicus]